MRIEFCIPGFVSHRAVEFLISVNTKATVPCGAAVSSVMRRPGILPCTRRATYFVS